MCYLEAMQLATAGAAPPAGVGAGVLYVETCMLLCQAGAPTGVIATY
jgi:hypothetical protein